ncbi:hypothetical protein JDV02_003096 [Purpureocillium takamizusanense]|uniref:BZIP domain-containing protein n=1 Tax=Purpureocillium takamizusanense TaxID=2060973 RepID=A0A9Q8V9D5_9HYPO|nr:uncharacterized protein JDV02_003096 [Purpureocillium takamizusanense]UNI16682.1 hypothetical protein JDV02_003096 [Purpureocillium takamizusanense]
MSPVHSTELEAHPAEAQYQSQKMFLNVPCQSRPPSAAPKTGNKTPRMVRPGIKAARDMPNSQGSRTATKKKQCRPVSTLTPEQLQRKRANDRKLQRGYLLKTKQTIRSLEKEVEDLERLRVDDSKTIQELCQRNQDLHIELISGYRAIGIQYSYWAATGGTTGGGDPSSTAEN